MKRLGENFRLRLLSLFVAIILWVYVISVQNPEIKKEIDYVPVKIINSDMLINSGLVLTNYQSNDTTVKIKGNQEITKKLTKDDIEAIADLRGCSKPGKYSIPVQFGLVGVQGVEIVSGEPHKIDLTVEKFSQVQKTVDVELQGEEKSEAKYLVKLVKPNTVTIGGPQSLIQNINAVKVIVDVSNLNKDISTIKKYRVYNKNNMEITDSRGMVRDNQDIQVEIDYLKGKEVPVVPKLTGSAANGYYISKVTANPAQIHVYGETDKVDKINSIDTERVNISGLSKDLVLSKKLVLPGDIKTDFENGIELSITVGKEESKTLDVQGGDISFSNRQEGYSYKILNSKVRLPLIIRDGQLASTDVKSLRPYIDAAGLKPGDYRLPINIAANNKVRIDGEKPTVKIRISGE